MQRLAPIFRRLLVLPLVVAAAACGDDPQPAEIRLSPSTISLDAVGDSVVVRATVIDEEGTELPGAAVSWTSSNPAVVRVNAEGAVTATGPGTASVRAEFGPASNQAAATVQIAVASLEAASDTAFDAQAGSTIAPVAVRAFDRLGNPAVGAPITGVVVGGGGSLVQNEVATNAQGVASFEWNVGPNVGEGRLRLRASGTAPAVFFGASVSAGPPAEIAQTGGAGQAGLPGAELPDALDFRVQDAFGNAIADAAVSFAVTQGGGSLSVTSAVTDEEGRVSTVLTLGAGAGEQIVEITSGSLTSTASATALTDPADIQVVGDPSVVGQVAAAATENIAVRLVDNVGAGIAGAPIRFAPRAGSGTVADAVGGSASPSVLILTDAQGDAVLPEWVLGTVSGQQTLDISFPGLGTLEFFGEALPGPAASAAVVSGNRQAAEVNTTLPEDVVFQFADEFGNATPDVSVNVAVTLGGGSVNASDAIADPNGQVVVQWTMGAGEALAGLSATTGGGSVSATADAAALPANPGNFNIDLIFLADTDTDIWYEFQRSVARWQGFITGDVSDVVSPNIDAGRCGSNSTALFDPIDDLVIFVSIVDIDGPGAVLGSAGPCFIRPESDTDRYLPMAGRMRFDVADLRTFQDRGTFDEIIVHEIGHVLGIGTLWSINGFLVNPTGSDGPEPTHFTGPAALQAFTEVGGDAYPGDDIVPVANTGGAGSRNGHWREGIFDTELMSPFIDSGFNPLSIVTVASLQDIGYVVDDSGADSYTLPSPTLRDGEDAADTRIHLHDDIWLGPIRIAPASWMR